MRIVWSLLHKIKISRDGGTINDCKECKSKEAEVSGGWLLKTNTKAVELFRCFFYIWCSRKKESWAPLRTQIKGSEVRGQHISSSKERFPHETCVSGYFQEDWNVAPPILQQLPWLQAVLQRCGQQRECWPPQMIDMLASAGVHTLTAALKWILLR